MAGDPRIRGEHEDKRYADWDRAGSSPHTRGAQPPGLRRRAGPGIIPAYAGSTPTPTWNRKASWDHPRIRGEHVPQCDAGGLLPGSSPHTRGAPGRTPLDRHAGGIIPAYAGSTKHPRLRRRARRDHPRIRGEHSDLRVVCHEIPGSSPHTRGARRCRCGPCLRRRIIPAYAGSTPKRYCLGLLPLDHPRIRGEHVAEIPSKIVKAGSSPHTRGAPQLGGDFADRLRIIPAYAGSTMVVVSSTGRRRDHPRIRGEHESSTSRSRPSPGSSPHTRGAPTPQTPRSESCGIIPAYAGSTWPTCSRTASPRDHPRIRGEHSTAVRRLLCHRGSSPHTRGAPT